MRRFRTCWKTAKKDGWVRPVVNLRKLNRTIPYQKFKMETMQNLKEVLQKGDLMIKIDLRDAYYSIPLHQESQHLVRFRWKGTLYQFLCLCFGIGPAPRIFTKTLKVPISVLRRLNIRLIIYLDDMIIMAQTEREIKIAREIFFYNSWGL